MPDYEKWSDDELYKNLYREEWKQIRGPIHGELEHRRSTREDAKFAKQLAVSRWAAVAAIAAAVAAFGNAMPAIIRAISG